MFSMISDILFLFNDREFIIFIPNENPAILFIDKGKAKVELFKNIFTLPKNVLGATVSSDIGKLEIELALNIKIQYTLM